ncbi:dihydrofolate reductase [uncultured Eubacterium sp.]|uniref:dihydrofolate reductase n=1 Tax=uncultured Eubacterium sp. TaxID=165185 RepID=UPI002804D7E2|nr:dihydrofolate reductase [uncultured Eubacterium sp.]
MSISIIAAVGKNLELGKNNDLIWHFKEDMRFFKETTTDHTVVMGRKTFESLPKALPNRRNIVISSNPDYVAEGAEVVTDINDIYSLAENDEVFIIGGGKIYSRFINDADKLYLTEIDAAQPSADVYFPSFDKAEYVREVINNYCIDGINFSHVLYSK